MGLKNIKPLDGIRTLAIAMVLVWHYFYYQVNPDSHYAIVRYLKFLTSFTWSGVDLFFVLSGFLIGRILIHYRESKNYFKTFYLRRIFRIFPAYYLVLFSFFAFVWSGASTRFPWLAANPHPYYSYIFYIQNFMRHGFGANWLSVTWSLAIEEQFYLIVPLLIFVIKPKYLPHLLILSIVAAPVFRALLHNMGSYILLPARMDSLSLGILIAYYHLNGAVDKVFKDKKKILLMMLIILFLAPFFIYGKSGAEKVGETFIHSILALTYGILILLVLVLDKSSFLSSSFMSFFARISYMMYLTHELFLGLLYQLILNLPPHIIDVKSSLITLMALIATIVFSTVSYYFFEKPILTIGKRYHY